MADGNDQYFFDPVAIDDQVRKSMQEAAANIVAASKVLYPTVE